MKDIKILKNKIIQKLKIIYHEKNEENLKKIKQDKLDYDDIYAKQKYKGRNPLFVLIQELRNNEYSKTYSLTRLFSFLSVTILPSVFVLNILKAINALEIFPFLCFSVIMTISASALYSVFFEGKRASLYPHETSATLKHHKYNKDYNESLENEALFYSDIEESFISNEKLSLIDTDIIKKIIDNGELSEILNHFNDNELKKLFEISYDNNNSGSTVTYFDIIQAIKYNEKIKFSDEMVKSLKFVKEKEFSIS